MRPLALALLAAALAAPLPALAEGRGGDRAAAGGAFMSSYNQNPYAPRGPGAAYARGAAGDPDPGFTGSLAPWLPGAAPARGVPRR